VAPVPKHEEKLHFSVLQSKNIHRDGKIFRKIFVRENYIAGESYRKYLIYNQAIISSAQRAGEAHYKLLHNVNNTLVIICHIAHFKHSSFW
jgi:uncharacterized protein with ParB-like and HNH nuclease domain